MIVRVCFLYVLVILVFWSGSSSFAAETKHSNLIVNSIPIQLPYASIEVRGDRLIDVISLQGILPLSVESRGNERVIRYGGHQLDVQPGRTAALLDGKWLVLKHAPIAEQEGLLIPERQLFDLLTIPYHVQEGKLVVNYVSPSINELQKNIVKLEGSKTGIGYIGILQPNRWIVAAKVASEGKPTGFGIMYEAAKEMNTDGTPIWKLNKLRTISDTAGAVYMEWMTNGSIYENIVSDKRPEFLFVESCNCAGRYQYGTMFTVTEMGLVPVWHSQATYDRVQKTAKGWALVTHRWDTIPTRTSATMPYWEIHEIWNGQSFVIAKQEYRDPLK